jgi:hypothetical protein
MQDIPSLPHSKKIRDLCNAHYLVDPFRVLYPNRRDFSYSPWGNLRRNRSRIDFFLVSSNIVDKVDDCFIKPHTQSKLFDHKAIVLDFCKKKAPVARPTISNSILRDPDVDIVVKLASLECYAQTMVDKNLKTQSLRMIGLALKNYVTWVRILVT